MSTEQDPHHPTVFHLDGALEQDPRLADLLDALRSPASPAELAAESSVLDRMLTALTPAPKERRPMKRHLVRTIAFATAGVLSAGGVAAAATGTNPLAPILGLSGSGPALGEPVITTSTTVATSSTTGPTTTVATTSTVAGAAPTATCENHGRRVSAVAQDRSLDGDRPHGELVSAAAREKDEPDGKVTTTTAASTASTASGASTSTATADDDCDKTEDDDHDDEVDDDHEDEVRAPTTTKVGGSGASESAGKGTRNR